MEQRHSTRDSFNDWGGGGDVTVLSPVWEGTSRTCTGALKKENLLILYDSSYYRVSCTEVRKQIVV